MNETNQTQQGPRVSHEQMRDLNRLRRSRDDRYVAGVAGGLGRHLDVDPTILRVLFVVLSFFGGAGVLLYGATWLLVPADGEAKAPFNVAPDTRRALLIGALVFGGLLMVGDVMGGFGGGGFFFGVVAVVAAVLLFNRDKNQTARQQWQGAPGAQPHEQTTDTSDSDVEMTAPLYGPEQTTQQVYADQPPAWQPPRPGAYVPPPRPRKTGMILFWPTLALIAIAMGTLGIFDNDNAVSNAAYPALALVITGVMLLVGAFIGRPGGLIAVGVIALLTLSATTIVGDGFDTTSREIRLAPTSAADVASSYSNKTGLLELDLTRVSDINALDGRQIELDINAGELRVIVPEGLTVNVDAELGFVGGIQVGDDSRDGFNETFHRVLGGAGPNAPTLDLELDARIGQITVRHP